MKYTCTLDQCELCIKFYFVNLIAFDIIFYIKERYFLNNNILAKNGRSIALPRLSIVSQKAEC